MQSLNNWKIDVAVLCIFFARPEQFEKTFEQVRKARPKTLLLWQDGPREGHSDDIENINKCRKIAENIDWECTVYRNYHEKNMGCDPSTFNSHQWAFSIVDKCIILEDDLVASQSFFTFCKEMLDKYEFDERIDRICGRNELGIYTDTPYDYFFSTRGCSWGWATWRRVAETWNRNYEFIDDEYSLRLLATKGQEKKSHTEWIEKCKRHKECGIPYWEDIIGARALLYTGLIIIPKYNLISNIGIGENSTHAPANINELPESAQRLFKLQSYELTFPLKEPKYIISDQLFEQKCVELFNPKSITEKIRRKYNHLMAKIKTGTLIESIKRKLN